MLTRKDLEKMDWRALEGCSYIEEWQGEERWTLASVAALGETDYNDARAIIAAAPKLALACHDGVAFARGICSLFEGTDAPAGRRARALLETFEEALLAAGVEVP